MTQIVTYVGSFFARFCYEKDKTFHLTHFCVAICAYCFFIFSLGQYALK